MLIHFVIIGNYFTFVSNRLIVIKRNYYEKISQSLGKKGITILIGARQVGKTTLLRKIIQDITQKGDLAIYLNLDIEDDASFFESQQKLLSRIRLEFGEKPGYVFIDEIQQKENAGRFLKGIFDMGLPYKFVVTGSGSLELKEKIGEALTGRKHLLLMDPVSFREFVDHKTNYKYSDRLDTYFSLEEEKTKSFLTEYLMYGGYPKVVSSDDIQTKTDVINEVFTSYISKDISYLMGVRSVDKFIKMIKLLAVQSGGIVNYANLASDTGISVDTLKNYLWYAEQTFIISIVKPYFTNAKKELTKSPVIYFNDPGMLNFASGNYSKIGHNKGFVFQNFVFNHLRMNYQTPVSPVNHWRTKDKAEVDFVIQKSEDIIPVEVKFINLKKKAISRSMHSFINRYKPAKVWVVNLNLDEKLELNNTTIEFLPFWKIV